MADNEKKGTALLWKFVNEFGERARANPEIVEAAIHRFLEAEIGRHKVAKAGASFSLDDKSEKIISEVFTPDELRDICFRDGAIYRRRMSDSESECSSSDEKIAYLTRLHDLVVAEAPDRDRRESRRPLAPDTNNVYEDIVRETLILPDQIPDIRNELDETGTCRGTEYLEAVRSELPLPAEVGQSEEAPPGSPSNPAPPPLDGQPPQKWSKLYGMEEAARILEMSTKTIRNYIDKHPESHWVQNRQKHRFDRNVCIFHGLK